MAGASRARRPAGAQQRSPRGARAVSRAATPLGRRSRLWRRFQPARARARPAASPALASRGPRRGASRRGPERIARWGDTWEEAGADLRASRQGRDLTVAFQKADLVSDLEGVLEGAPHLVTAAALFDLVSAEWIRRLAAAVAAREAVFYTVLTYNGTESWSPAHPSDAAIRAAFHAHQGGDKGFGPAAGPAASERLAEAFLAAGYRVRSADSPWRLGLQDAELVGELAKGTAGAVQGPARSEMTKSRRGSKRAFQRPPASWGIPTCWPSPAETPPSARAASAEASGRVARNGDAGRRSRGPARSPSARTPGHSGRGRSASTGPYLLPTAAAASAEPSRTGSPARRSRWRSSRSAAPG